MRLRGVRNSNSNSNNSSFDRDQDGDRLRRGESISLSLDRQTLRASTSWHGDENSKTQPPETSKESNHNNASKHPPYRQGKTTSYPKLPTPCRCQRHALCSPSACTNPKITRTHSGQQSHLRREGQLNSSVAFRGFMRDILLPLPLHEQSNVSREHRDYRWFGTRWKKRHASKYP